MIFALNQDFCSTFTSQAFTRVPKATQQKYYICQFVEVWTKKCEVIKNIYSSTALRFWAVSIYVTFI